jgi:hypothetical protein
MEECRAARCVPKLPRNSSAYCGIWLRVESELGLPLALEKRAPPGSPEVITLKVQPADLQRPLTQMGAMPARRPGSENQGVRNSVRVGEGACTPPTSCLL